MISMLLNQTPKPKDFDIDHDQWRPNQYEAIEWILDHMNSKIILSAPTGSGKTSIAAAIAHKQKTTALCRTKNLQEANYERTYGFDPMYGKGNYPCVHPKYLGTRADTCSYMEKGGMYKCPHSGGCPYLVQLNTVMFSDKATLNYAYWLSARWAKERPPEILFMDEAHQLSEITLSWAGVKINEKTRKEWELEEFPELSGRSEGSLLLQSSSVPKDPIEVVIDWLMESARKLDDIYMSLQENMHDDKVRKKMKRCDSLARKMKATIDALNLNPTDWFIRSGQRAGKDASGKISPALVCKPLTAKYHFEKYFMKAKTSVMMSATIGSPDAFAEELGIDDYLYHEIPNQWKPEVRPIYDLGAPRMGYKSTKNDYEKQADVIAQAILDCPPDWSGVIHVTRVTESRYLSQRLAKRGLRNRLWTPTEGDGTNIQMRKWNDTKRKIRGAIGIVYSFWEGVDLTEERINIVAKTPFPPLGDDYEKARMKYSSKTYQWRTANQLMQGWGRTRRGEPEDYDLNGIREQLVGIADGNWTRVRKYLNQDIINTIQKY